MRGRHPRCWQGVFSAVLVAWAAFATVASGQSSPTLPAMKFVTASLVSPTTAETHYGASTVHTYGLSTTDFPVLPPEIVETARALKNDPDLIFEFVHNQIQTEFAFGERKGPVGTLIDKSGTPLDQNVLFVNLVRVGNPSGARYQVGRVTIAAADFINWTGVSDIKAACNMLANGGIPAAFNGASSTNCSTVSGTFTSVTILHIWSQVLINAVWYAYDPSFKVYSTPVAPVDLTQSGITPGAAAGAACPTTTPPSCVQSTQSGAPYLLNVGASSLNAWLTARGTQLLSYLKANAASSDTDTVVGITKIQPIYKPVGGWRNASPPGYTSIADLTIANDIPDQYRTQFQVSMSGALDGINQSTLFTKSLFVDEIDGRRVGIDTNFTGGANPQSHYTSATETLNVDDVAVATASCAIPSQCLGGGYPGQISLTATHPFAAGTFADQTVVKALTTFAAPVAIVSGWGMVSPDRMAKWSDELANDTSLPHGGTIPYRCEGGTAWCKETYAQSRGDFTRQKLAASWLAQMTRMVTLQAWISETAIEHHHSIGVVDWRAFMQGNQYPPPPTAPSPDNNWLSLVDEFTDLNIDTVVAVTSKVDTRAAPLPTIAAVSRSVAVASATLEGSVLEQMEDLPDTASTTSRFAWGNQPDNEDPCFTTNNPRRFYDYSSTSSSVRSGLYVYEGSTAGCGAGPNVQNGGSTYYNIQTEAAIAAYIAAGFHVTSSAETFLGPGARFGPAHTSGSTPYNDPSMQRGSALVGTLFDGSGNVMQVAHVLTGYGGITGSINNISKGGGGKQPERFVEYDPAKAADALKDRFVDRSVVLGVDLKTGTVGYTTPALLSVGTGSAPYKLDYGLIFKAAPSGCASGYGPCTGPIQGGWNQTWDVRFSNSGSGLEGMGATSPFAASGTLVAYLAMQDIFTTGSANLTEDVFAALVGDWWRQQMVANTVTINRGFSGSQYVRLVDGNWLPPIGSPGVLTQTGIRIKVRDHCQPQASTEYPYSTSRRWDHSAVGFSLRAAGGDVLSVLPWNWNYETDNACAIVYGYQPSTWTWPQGPVLTFTYDYQQGVTNIASSLGRSISFTGLVGGHGILTASAPLPPTTPPTPPVTAGQISGSAIADAINTPPSLAEVWNFTYTPILARAASQRPVPYAQLSQVFEPVSTIAPALQYTYDTRGLVETAADATGLQWGTRGPYTWFLALGGRGERDDPQPASVGGPGAYTVYYDTDGNEVRNIDELGREVDSAWDGRHRVTTRTFPETDQEQFAYDANDNVLSLTKVAKTGSGLANIVVHASYDPTWNKLASIIDPMGNETDFTYYPNTGACGTTGATPAMMCKAQRPAVGGTRPTFTYQYNAIGLPTQGVDPTGVTTTHVYNALGDLTSTTDGAAAVGSNPALNLTTNFTPNAVGDVIAVVDPRGNAATTQYDAMRRKIAEQNRNGGVAALPLMAKTFVYDLNGRLTTENRATGFDGSGNPTGLQTWLTAYTPTGKTAQTTDPLLFVNRTIYDQMDRVGRVIDASGAVTQKTYDLAGEELTEMRGVAAGLTPPQQITYATYTWWPDGEKQSVKDANGNLINLAYDGFNRLATITHPDSTTEQSQYDPDGDLVIWTNRGGFGIVRCYDVLNRKISETGTTGAALSGACATGGTSNLATRSWDIQPRTFGYDLAGRLTLASIPSFPLSYSYDAAGRPTARGASWSAGYGWDAAGNLTALTYPDGSVVDYQYDALNRTTKALNGSTSYGTQTWDALGRRSVLTFHDTSTQTWGYDGADRVTSIAHAFPKDVPDNVTLTYTYDNAGREIARTTSNSAYAYIPSLATTAYAAANALNQYPTVASYPYTWWPEGGLKQSAALQANYDEQGKLMLAYITATPGVIDTNNFEYMAVDALGHLYAHARQTTAGQDFPFIYHSTDGLRPETILEWQCHQKLNVAPTCTGAGTNIRRYVLGPDPDERWAFIDGQTIASSVVDNPHTDREGAIIALSNGGTVAQKYAYDAYGQSSAPLSDVGPGSNTYAYRFTGQRLDPNTGLYDYKARDYSTALGRFVQPDPAGLDQGPSLYAYVENDPVNGADPTGNCNQHSGCGEGIIGDATSPTGSLDNEVASYQQADYVASSTPPGQHMADSGRDSTPVTRQDNTAIAAPNTRGGVMLKPTAISMQTNIVVGRAIGILPPGEKEAALFGLFRPGGSMDYQRTFGSHGKINRAFIDFGAYNFGVVAAAAHVPLSEALHGAGFVNQGPRGGIFNNNPRIEADIRLGYSDFGSGIVGP